MRYERCRTDAPAPNCRSVAPSLVRANRWRRERSAGKSVAVFVEAESTRQHVRAAWAARAGVDYLKPLQVLTQPESPLLWAPGWTVILRIEQCVTAVAPTRELARSVTAALSGLSPSEATSPDKVVPRLSNVIEIGDTSKLYYPLDELRAPTSAARVEVVPLSAVDDLLVAVSREELEASGLRSVASDVSVVRDEFGEPIAACGYRRWPQQLADLCVLTRADHRGKGLAAAVGINASRRALSEGLLPQWSARPAASQAVARAMGFTELGDHFSFRIADT